ncbi:Tubulin-tyrosine ligase [Phytophthora megakarya]|uniref:Tubulin-tyrosine ligase n=1 Tax=Phytophthora megakarya TaxID=4795 RepID=A0A225V5E3_9STRA|nr:Tubulin-tyrosine ligase [Phytophthora megakarya]
MRLQQKLYESWQSIMQDYATVFGAKIVVPEGMVPIAAAEPWAPHYRINSTARKEVSEIVTEALHHLGGGWEEHPSGLGLKTTWNLLWTWSKPRVERQTLLVWQKVNHFQHAKALTRKDCLKKHIGKYIAAGGRLRQAFDIIPPTFLLPKEYVAFVQAFQERSERLKQSGASETKNIWIMKPVALSRGRGISLINDLSQVIYGEQMVIQEYIAAPRLLDGFKFDLRLYVLVTSFNPLEAYLYNEGFVRLCTQPYEDNDINNIFVHLTNSSIQKDNESAIVGSTNPIARVKKQNQLPNSNNDNESDQKGAGGTKTTLAYLWRRLAAEGVDVEQVKRNIEEVVIKALLCGEDHIPYQVNSFDLLGYDILLDADLRPWLIEINSSPSMARDNNLDYQVKDAMMVDTLRVVDPLHFDRAKLAEVIARRQRDLEDEKRRPHANTRHPRETEELTARQLNEDLTAILRGKIPRAYGEMPENIGNYRRLCPYTTIYNQLVKLKRSCLRKA